MNVQKAEFVLSAADARQFVRDAKPKIVFAGRSNVGKSSVINRLLNRKNFARVGASPGKTSHVNYFLIDGTAYFVDLPGYGYAKVSKAERERWGKLMERFFAEKSNVGLGVLIVDSRHTPTEDDAAMAELFRSVNAPLLVVANKVDKLKKSEIAVQLGVVAKKLSLPEQSPPILFSAEKGTGRDELLSRIEAFCAESTGVPEPVSTEIRIAKQNAALKTKSGIVTNAKQYTMSGEAIQGGVLPGGSMSGGSMSNAAPNGALLKGAAPKDAIPSAIPDALPNNVTQCGAIQNAKRNAMLSDGVSDAMSNNTAPNAMPDSALPGGMAPSGAMPGEKKADGEY